MTVGEWVRGQVDAWRTTPRTILDTAGRSEPNPAYATAAHAASSALRTLAGHLGIPLDEVGPCVTCHAYHHRYGTGGRPLCPTCHTAATEQANRRYRRAA
ncbi:hypothetical protein [Parafrankia sp. EUN1f]|uniref:hypothetical protein n=1 Tax=Parafrankia sp. EUN1f TaxID=102897 RepID=UPI0001C46909|nr:hypothetical protein [Parafrankia sp. EUN1f]EFC80266.1 hypothetical protein FrEUN1fDRAFT_6600 [Parafrankia sp. EUN1f]